MTSYTGGPNTVVATADASTGFRFDVLALAGGNYVVIWTGTSTTSSQTGDFHGQIYDASGVKVGSPFQIGPDESAHYQLHFDSALQDGGFMVSWRDTQGTSTIQRFDANGNAVGATTHDNVDDMVQLANGTFIGIGHSATGSDVNFQFYDSNLQPVGSVMTANGTGEVQRSFYDIATFADGGFAMV